MPLRAPAVAPLCGGTDSYRLSRISMVETETREFDVVVVGAGIGGLLRQISSANLRLDLRDLRAHYSEELLTLLQRQRLKLLSRMKSLIGEVCDHRGAKAVGRNLSELLPCKKTITDRVKRHIGTSSPRKSP